MRIRKDILDYAYFIVFGLLIVMFVTGQFSNVTGVSLVVIDNPDPNSMFPTYFQGDLFLLHKDDPGSIELGDVIVYDAGARGRIIHRVIDIIERGGEYFYRVKGDNPNTNETPDGFGNGTLIPFDAVIGKVIQRIPYIGHISLAIQQNAAIQLLVIFIAIIAGIVILVWPEDEEEDEVDYFNVTTETFYEFKGRITGWFGSIFQRYRDPKYRGVKFGFTFLFVVMIISFFVIPGMVPIDTNKDVGINDIEIGKAFLYTEGEVANADMVFLNASIHIFDDTTRFHRILGYTMRVLDDSGTVLSETVWNTRRLMKGQFMVGGSIVFDLDDVDQYTAPTDLTVEVVLEARQGLTTTQYDPYTETFVFSPPVS